MGCYSPEKNTNEKNAEFVWRWNDSSSWKTHVIVSKNKSSKTTQMQNNCLHPDKGQVFCSAPSRRENETLLKIINRIFSILAGQIV